MSNNTDGIDIDQTLSHYNQLPEHQRDKSLNRPFEKGNDKAETQS